MTGSVLRAVCVTAAPQRVQKAALELIGLPHALQCWTADAVAFMGLPAAPRIWLEM